jgi:hypothetical protein
MLWNSRLCPTEKKKKKRERELRQLSNFTHLLRQVTGIAEQEIVCSAMRKQISLSCFGQMQPIFLRQLHQLNSLTI